MKNRILSALAIALLTAPANGQSVTLPLTTMGVPGQWIVLAPLQVDGGPVRWRFDPALQEVNLGQLLPDEMVAKLKGKVVSATAPGRYKYEAWNAKGDVASDIAVGWVVILGPTPPPVPPSPPVPPEPKPPPPSPSPFPLPGFRTLVVYEEIGGVALLSKAQTNELLGEELHKYLNAKCVKGPDGKQAEFRIWKKDVALVGAEKHWKDAMATVKGPFPRLIVSDGVNWFDEPLPEGGAILTRIRKLGG